MNGSEPRALTLRRLLGPRGIPGLPCRRTTGDDPQCEAGVGVAGEGGEACFAVPTLATQAALAAALHHPADSASALVGTLGACGGDAALDAWLDQAPPTPTPAATWKPELRVHWAAFAYCDAFLADLIYLTSYPTMPEGPSQELLCARTSWVGVYRHASLSDEEPITEALWRLLLSKWLGQLWITAPVLASCVHDGGARSGQIYTGLYELPVLEGVGGASEVSAESLGTEAGRLVRRMARHGIFLPELTFSDLTFITFGERGITHGLFLDLLRKVPLGDDENAASGLTVGALQGLPPTPQASARTGLAVLMLESLLGDAVNRSAHAISRSAREFWKGVRDSILRIVNFADPRTRSCARLAQRYLKLPASTFDSWPTARRDDNADEPEILVGPWPAQGLTLTAADLRGALRQRLAPWDLGSAGSLPELSAQLIRAFRRSALRAGSFAADSLPAQPHPQRREMSLDQLLGHLDEVVLQFAPLPGGTTGIIVGGLDGAPQKWQVGPLHIAAKHTVPRLDGAFSAIYPALQCQLRILHSSNHHLEPAVYARATLFGLTINALRTALHVPLLPHQGALPEGGSKEGALADWLAKVLNVANGQDPDPLASLPDPLTSLLGHLQQWRKLRWPPRRTRDLLTSTEANFEALCNAQRDSGTRSLMRKCMARAGQCSWQRIQPNNPAPVKT